MSNLSEVLTKDDNINEKNLFKGKRRKQFRQILTWTLFTLGGLLVFGTILDLGAFARFGEYNEQIHKFTEVLFTSCVGVLCLVLAFERKLDFDNIETTLEKQNEVLLEQKEYFMTENKMLGDIGGKLEDVHKLTDKIYTQTDIIEQMRHVRNKHFDPFLNIIFKDFIDDTIDFFKNGIVNKKITFNEVDRFEKAYSICLKELESCHLMATSLTHPGYFWTKEGEPDNAIEILMRKFIRERDGKISRIFFVEENESDSPGAISVLNKQVSLGVEVFTIPKIYVSSGNCKYFVVDDKKRISWHVYTDENKNINKFIYSANERDIEKYYEIFETLKNSRHCKLYKKQKISKQ